MCWICAIPLKTSETRWRSPVVSGQDTVTKNHMKASEPRTESKHLVPRSKHESHAVDSTTESKPREKNLRTHNGAPAQSGNCMPPNSEQTNEKIATQTTHSVSSPRRRGVGRGIIVIFRVQDWGILCIHIVPSSVNWDYLHLGKNLNNVANTIKPER